MDSLLNSDRPPVFCPGCSHERVVRVLDRALVELSLGSEQTVIVTDIGCSGLLDVFFKTHAFHGLHGRALTYATGIKLAKPELHVIAIMGDGGMGIGGAHFLSACRRNLDLTLLVLNNFNYGMTGGQCSATTPREASVGSGFLNRLEKPLDICWTAVSAGSPWAARISCFDKRLVEKIKEALSFSGFSVMDIWGVCSGRFSRRNMLTPKLIEERLAQLPPLDEFAFGNQRPEYGLAYRKEAAGAPAVSEPVIIENLHQPPQKEPNEVLILGEAGQRIVTAGEILCLAGASGGLYATQKNDYPITVMRGHSISEIILSAAEIGYTGMQQPSTILALGREGINRRKKIFEVLHENSTVIKDKDAAIPETSACVIEIDFKGRKIKKNDFALFSLAVIASNNRVISMEMLKSALKLRFQKQVLEKAETLVDDARGVLKDLS